MQIVSNFEGSRGTGVGPWRVFAIVAVACAVLFVTNGFILGGLTVFDASMLRELRIGNGELRLRDTITVATLGLSVPLIGYLLDRFAVRPVLIGGLLLMAGAFVGYAHINSLWQVYALHVALGLSQATSGVVACVYLVSGWTRTHRGLALGIVIAGSSLGNALVPTLNTMLIEHLPWRSAILSGAVVATLLIPIVLLIVREPVRVMTAPAAVTDGHETAPPVAIGPYVRSREFILLAVTAGSTVFCVLALATNLALFVASPGGAGAGSGPVLLFALFGAAVIAQVVAGLATYRIAVGLIHGAAVTVMLAGGVCFAFASPRFALAAITLFGVGWGANSTMLQVRPTLFFPGPALGRILSLLALAETIGGGIGPAVAGYVSDRAGFASAFLMVALIMFVPTTLAIALRPKKKAGAANADVPPICSGRNA